MTNPARDTVRFRNLALVVIFAAALILRLLYVATESLPPDTDNYRAIASNLASGNGFAIEPGKPTAFRPPGYPLLIAVVESLAPTPRAVLYLQCILGASLVFLAAWLARFLVGDIFALVAAIIVAVDPFQIHACGLFMTEVLFAFLVTATFVTFLRAIRARSPGRYALAGLVASAAFLTRPEFFVFAVGGVVGAVLWGRRRRKLLCLLVFVVSLSLLPGAWLIRNRCSTGSWTLSTTHGGYTHLLPYNTVFYNKVVAGPSDTWSDESLAAWQQQLREETAGLSEVERDRHFYAKARNFVREDFKRAAHIALFEAGRFWGIFPHSVTRGQGIFLGAFFVVLLVLAVPGALAAWRRPCVVPLVVYLLAAETLLHMYYWSNIRMRTPFHPLLAVLAAAGVATLFGRRSFIGEAVPLPEEDPLYSPAV